MGGFGDRLRAARESRGFSIEQFSAATGVHPSYLEALETETFHALPGRSFGKLYIRTCAEALGVEARPLIEEYDRARAALESARSSTPAEPEERRQAQAAIDLWRQAMVGQRQKARPCAASPIADASEDAGKHGSVLSTTGPIAREPQGAGPPGADSPETDQHHDVLTGNLLIDDSLKVDAPSGHARRDRPRRETPWIGWRRVAAAALVFTCFSGGAATVYFVFLRRAVEASDLATPPSAAGRPGAAAAAPAPVPAMTSPIPTAPEAGASRIAAPPEPVWRHRSEGNVPSDGRPRAGAIPPSSAWSSTMSVPESGVGRGVAQRRLLEPAVSFSEGSIVWFSTRVVGGAPGERIRHVWIREGRTMQSITLRIGGRDWRTQSRKTIYGAGRWAVEARDESGRVLARSEFTCAPGPS